MGTWIDNVTPAQKALQNILVLENVFKYTQRRDLLSFRVVHSTWLRVIGVLGRERKIFKLTFSYSPKAEEYRIQEFESTYGCAEGLEKVWTDVTLPISCWTLLHGPLDTGDVLNFLALSGHSVRVLDVSFGKFGMLMDISSLWRVLQLTPRLENLFIEFLPAHWLGCDWEVMFSTVTEVTLDILAARHHQFYLEFVKQLKENVPRIVKFDTTCPGGCCQKYHTRWPGQRTTVKPRYGRSSQSVVPR